ncbi:hypothetical protein PAAG_03239 [Paracoccidioides lutzii Pb01]|uniref:Nascent polypeptide-associated complex subunit alpha-like UBA domain-containing protein n=1 Tax=Paracoccidioides lutzii (strain ATCC MYA-826 / Pb01) TaxID=502779 RepID=C1GXV6_PARBA|nr:hypothetical protein PAAG_03239 [Paracoccidioides lutzii Pb01]EEH41676.1 hypothetical protein PAAG_03239 [Paracoccidioides lutzii Pb01]
MSTSNRRIPADTDPSSNNNDDDNGESASELPTNAEDRAAAAALSSLDTANKTCASENDACVPSGAVLPSAADQEALGKAMSRLELIAGVGKAGGSGAGGAAGSGKKDDKAKKSKTDIKAEEKEKAVKKVVKVAAEDVGLLVDQLDLTKVKATELLRSYEGDPIRAIRAYIAPPTPH